MKLARLFGSVLALLGGVFASAAMAATQNLGALAVGVPAPFAAFDSPGAFLDAFEFSVASPSIAGAAVANFGAFPAFDTKLQLISLVSNPDGIPFNGDDVLVASNLAVGNVLLLASPVAAGNYFVSVLGTAIGPSGGVYHGNVLLTPVPEPEPLALMLAGIGVVGLLVKRRSASSE